TKGFRVLEAIDGSSALELIRGDDEIEAMVLDLTLPGISSRRIFEDARSLRPDIKIILTTAYGREMVESTFNGLHVEHFLRQPFRLAELSGMLKSQEPSPASATSPDELKARVHGQSDL